MKSFKNCIFLTPIITLLLSSCASYSASPLVSPSYDLLQTAVVKEGVTVFAKAYSRADAEEFLDRDVISEGYQPVQIYVQNDSPDKYVFSLNRISLPIACPQAVAEKVHTSTVGRAVGYGAGALVFWPLAIPAVVDGIKSSQANRALDADFSRKAARDQIIAPHSRFNAIVFVPCNQYHSCFQLTLIDYATSQPKTFDLIAQG